VRPANRIDLTGKEYAKVMEFLRRWHAVPPPEPSPKRLIFAQPIQELRPQAPAKPQAPAPGKPAELSPPQKPKE
jgi:hypothetical protein